MPVESLQALLGRGPEGHAPVLEPLQQMHVAHLADPLLVFGHEMTK